MAWADIAVQRESEKQISNVNILLDAAMQLQGSQLRILIAEGTEGSYTAERGPQVLGPRLPSHAAERHPWL